MVTREDGVYDGTKQRSDIVLVSPTGQRQIIELKCQSKGKDAIGLSILQEVKEDAQKLAQNLKAEFRPAKCFAVGIACTPDAINEVLNFFNTVPGPQWVGNWALLADNGYPGIYVFWVESNVN